MQLCTPAVSSCDLIDEGHVGAVEERSPKTAKSLTHSGVDEY